MFWIGVNYSGALGVYMLNNFQVTKISNSTIDSFLMQAVARDSYSVVGSGLSGQGHIYYTLTFYLTPSDIVPSLTLVYDSTTQLWGEWETTVNGLSKFPLVAWTKRETTSERFGEGILVNGDLISVNDNLMPSDTLKGATYVTAGYVEAGYVSNTAESGTAIKLKCRLGMYDGGTNNYKYPEDLRFVGDTTPNSQTMTIRWANENNKTFNTGQTLDTSKYKRLFNLGRYRRRNHEIEYVGSDTLRAEALEGDVTVGDY